MPGNTYAAGDRVPEGLLQTPGEGSSALEFAVSVEVVEGFDGFRHVYPREPIDNVEGLVEPREGTAADLSFDPSEKVRFYTLPRDAL